jgi:hypothetical protein
VEDYDNKSERWTFLGWQTIEVLDKMFDFYRTYDALVNQFPIEMNWYGDELHSGEVKRITEDPLVKKFELRGNIKFWNSAYIMEPNKQLHFDFNTRQDANLFPIPVEIYDEDKSIHRRQEISWKVPWPYPSYEIPYTSTGKISKRTAERFQKYLLAHGPTSIRGLVYADKREITLKEIETERRKYYSSKYSECKELLLQDEFFRRKPTWLFSTIKAIYRADVPQWIIP